MNEVCGNCIWAGRANTCDLNKKFEVDEVKEQEVQLEKDKETKKRSARAAKRLERQG